jgi:hypothetical protein
LKTDTPKSILNIGKSLPTHFCIDSAATENKEQ